MNRSQKTTYIQTGLILAAMAAGALMTRIVPERRPLAAYRPVTHVIPTTAVFKSASVKKDSHDRWRDLTGVDVDLRRLALLGRVS